MAATIHAFKPGFEPASLGLGPHDRLMSFALAAATFLSHPSVRGLFRLMIAEGRRFDRAAAVFREETLVQAMVVGSALVRQMVAAGELANCDADEVTRQLMSMIEHEVLLLPLLLGDHALIVRPAHKACAQAVGTILRGYAP